MHPRLITKLINPNIYHNKHVITWTLRSAQDSFCTGVTLMSPILKAIQWLMMFALWNFGEMIWTFMVTLETVNVASSICVAAANIFCVLVPRLMCDHRAKLEFSTHSDEKQLFWWVTETGKGWSGFQRVCPLEQFTEDYYWNPLSATLPATSAKSPKEVVSAVRDTVRI